jgi:GNAT superfamily N-acetyltransferase
LNLIFSKLNRNFDRISFNCGNEDLNLFLQKHAYKNQGIGISQTWICHKNTETEIIGYYTLNAASIEREALPHENAKRLPGYPVPCVLLARLAVDTRYQKKGMGKFLLKNALERIITYSEQIGAYAVVVHAKNDQVKNFYEQYGFIELPQDELTLFIPIVTIKKAMENKP